MSERIDTAQVPGAPYQEIAHTKPRLLQSTEHSLCPGCGEPVALRILLEAIDEVGAETGVIGVVGHGCYGSLVQVMDIDVLQCLHGRAPACATGIKRVRPDTLVVTLQGDGDMVDEGLAEVLHAAARAESITCVLLNNGVFGDTGGQMTATTVVGQRTKTSLEGRDPSIHGYPIPIADLLSQLEGATYVSRGTVGTPSGIAKTKRLLKKALLTQKNKGGFTFVEIMTMCPTGWFVTAGESPTYMHDVMNATFPLGELKDAT